MSGYPGHHDYDDGYGHHPGNTDSYYQDDNQQYYDHNGYDAQGGHNGGDGYYDESYAFAPSLLLVVGTL